MRSDQFLEKKEAVRPPMFKDNKSSAPKMGTVMRLFHLMQVIDAVAARLRSLMLRLLLRLRSPSQIYPLS